jgi:hypothetical protein
MSSFEPQSNAAGGVLQPIIERHAGLIVFFRSILVVRYQLSLGISRATCQATMPTLSRPENAAVLKRN